MTEDQRSSDPLNQFTPPEEWPDAVLHDAILRRIRLNLDRTGHPFHHRTADGTIVDADPTLEHLIALLREVQPAVPVNRQFYGFDPYEQP